MPTRGSPSRRRHRGRAGRAARRSGTGKQLRCWEAQSTPRPRAARPTAFDEISRTREWRSGVPGRCPGLFLRQRRTYFPTAGMSYSASNIRGLEAAGDGTTQSTCRARGGPGVARWGSLHPAASAPEVTPVSSAATGRRVRQFENEPSRAPSRNPEESGARAARVDGPSCPGPLGSSSGATMKGEERRHGPCSQPVRPRHARRRRRWG